MALCPSTRASDTSSEMVHDWYVDLCCFRYPLFYVLNQNKGSGVKTLFQSTIHFLFCNIISRYMISLSWIHPWSDGYIWDLWLYHAGELTWIFGILGVPPLWNRFCWCHHPRQEERGRCLLPKHQKIVIQRRPAGKSYTHYSSYFGTSNQRSRSCSIFIFI